MSIRNTIVAVSNSASNGKSETLRELAKLLVPQGQVLSLPDGVVPADRDFRLIIKIQGVVIGIETAGDYGDSLKKSLAEMLGEFHVNIIFCPTRSKGSTVYTVNEFAKENDFETIWTSTYSGNKKQEAKLLWEQLNKLKAKHLEELLWAFLNEKFSF